MYDIFHVHVQFVLKVLHVRCVVDRVKCCLVGRGVLKLRISRGGQGEGEMWSEGAGEN